MMRATDDLRSRSDCKLKKLVKLKLVEEVPRRS